MYLHHQNDKFYFVKIVKLTFIIAKTKCPKFQNEMSKKREAAKLVESLF